MCSGNHAYMHACSIQAVIYFFTNYVSLMLHRANMMRYGLYYLNLRTLCDKADMLSLSLQ